jgi:hypothetical protein
LLRLKFADYCHHDPAAQVINYPSWHNLATVKGDFVLVKLDLPVDFSRLASPIWDRFYESPFRPKRF